MGESLPTEPSDYEIIRSGLLAAELEGRVIDDGTARRLAMQLHGGQATAMYSLGSCGAINQEDLAWEMVRDMHSIPRGDELRLWYDDLASYCIEKGDRGPQEGWYRLTADDAPHICWLPENSD